MTLLRAALGSDTDHDATQRRTPTKPGIPGDFEVLSGTRRRRPDVAVALLRYGRVDDLINPRESPSLPVGEPMTTP
jgi:hypothetical protein